MPKFSAALPTPQTSGDFEEMCLAAGRSVGLVGEVKSAGEIMAAAIAVLIARTRYQKFIPPEQMGNDNDVPFAAMDAIRKKVKEGSLIGPRVLMAGHILDGPKPVMPTNVAIGSEREARQTVVGLKKDGVDFIKVYTGLPRDLYFTIADEAKKQGLPFVGHVPISVTPEEASDAGQRSFEHMTGVIDGCSEENPD